MTELLTNLFGAMRAGYLQYANGMYTGVFFVAMLFLWLVCYEKFAAKTEGKKTDGRKGLFLYALAMTVLVLCPVSAFFLLKYQTAFFTYSQLFLLIPMTPVMAWAFTEAVTVVLGKMPVKLSKTSKRSAQVPEVLAVIVVAFVLFMAGNVSVASEPTAATENDKKIPAGVLEVLKELCDGETDLEKELILAPDEVLEYARAYSADIKLLYGRNMWQKELNAYTYDTYAPELEEVHAWLNPKEWEESVVSDNLTAKQAFDVIKLYGATVLVLTKEQFAVANVNAALTECGFSEIAGTEDYIIIELR